MRARISVKKCSHKNRKIAVTIFTSLVKHSLDKRDSSYRYITSYAVTSSLYLLNDIYDVLIGGVVCSLNHLIKFIPPWRALKKFTTVGEVYYFSPQFLLFHYPFRIRLLNASLGQEPHELTRPLGNWRCDIAEHWDYNGQNSSRPR